MMEGKIISMFEAKKNYGKEIVLTDELLDLLGEEFQNEKDSLPHPMSFYQWIEYRLIRYM